MTTMTNQGVVAEAVRRMDEAATLDLIRSIPPADLHVWMNGLPEHALFDLVGRLPDDADAKRKVAIEIGMIAFRQPTPPQETEIEPAPRRERRSPTGRRATPRREVATTKDAATSDREPGQKRSPKELADLTKLVFTTIRSNPGIRMEALAKAVDHPTRELSLPIKKLLADNKITTAGQKRATEYSVA